jgi:hypothetical protein
MEADNLKVWENRTRRRLARLGFRLAKTPARSWVRQYHEPGYVVLKGNTCRCGGLIRPYDATRDDVDAFLEREERRMSGSSTPDQLA